MNLGLDVIGRRPDGYHLVKMVMQTVDLSDEVTLWREDAGEGEAQDLQIQLTCDHPSVPQDERNLAWKAARRIGDRFQLKGRVRIHIAKRIPVEAGMAGGSTDGAAVIQAMNQLYSLQMSPELQDEIAVSLGADVPFCLRRGTYLSEGIGEQLTKLPDLPHCTMIIVKPDVSVSTAWAYRSLDSYSEDHKGAIAHPDIDKLVEALYNRSIDNVAEHMGNILELVTVSEYPVIRDIEDQLIKYGAVRALMSGSGPTVFGIFTDEEKAEQAFSHLGGEAKKYGKFKVEF